VKQAILIVDDEAILLLSIRQELKLKYGARYIYETALSAEIGFETIGRLVREGVVVVMVISDWLMPGMKGDEFLRLVHAEYPDIKLMMMSGHVDDQQMKDFSDAVKLVAFLRKPYVRNNLFEIIDRALPDESGPYGSTA
jgi:DNA-binding NtrC family response regulator